MATDIVFDPGESPKRPVVAYSSLPELSSPFFIDPATRSYKHQYSNIYFVRLIELRPIVEERAVERWANIRGNPPLLPRILNLQRGQLCYIVGTVYLDMPLKPNVLDEMAQSHYVAAPAPRPKFFSAQDSVHVEDESGRVRLVGPRIREEREKRGGLVTGVIMGVLGVETGGGDFEVVDLCYAGMPRVFMPAANGKGKEREEGEGGDAMDVDESREKTWVALVSGLSIGTETALLDMKAQLLVEWLMGETGGVEDQRIAERITRLVLVGNSLSIPVVKDDRWHKKAQAVGVAPHIPNHPTKVLAGMLRDLLASSLPVNLIPGAEDPAGALLPQQPMPKVMFGGRKMEGLECVTNPTWLEVGERSMLCSGGQSIDDIFKYLPGTQRLRMARRTLEWRHLAPTAPDTLSVYPYPDTDPFIIHHRPDIYVIGNQPEFETELVGDDDPTRVILLPSFAETGTVALVCLETLEVKTVTFEVPQWAGDVPSVNDT
ncbi:hypothetical protein CspeluHIS016_0205140 [Cutaneotrichosporon spelunceum]|uniref:DNA-directed DNA polymerase n=1 Tax=Cutaneotrichosporon spelunceum TaxID=1672016 RepID=A0AAD3TRS8_9TREE|nr:hypothetical protein CspeluHIS016_0205140 [Cutaneotrichosporon spelunceum]